MHDGQEQNADRGECYDSPTQGRGAGESQPASVPPARSVVRSDVGPDLASVPSVRAFADAFRANVAAGLAAAFPASFVRPSVVGLDLVSTPPAFPFSVVGPDLASAPSAPCQRRFRLRAEPRAHAGAGGAPKTARTQGPALRSDLRRPTSDVRAFPPHAPQGVSPARGHSSHRVTARALPPLPAATPSLRCRMQRAHAVPAAIPPSDRRHPPAGRRRRGVAPLSARRHFSPETQHLRTTARALHARRHPHRPPLD